jgi:ABC-type hemin transport system substrate-binding protein
MGAIQVSLRQKGLTPLNNSDENTAVGAGPLLSTTQFGLIAEEVVKVNPDLVLLDKDGNPFTVRYDQVNAMLLNEFLKEHATIQELKEEITALKAGLQEVSNQLKMSRPAQLAENGQ